METNPIKEKIDAATAAVVNITDPELKKIAFQTVLSNLLAGTGEKQPKHSIKSGVRKKSSGKVKTDPSREIPASSLKLSPEQHQELKNFYDLYGPTSTETAVFNLALFLKEKLTKESFTEKDIEHLYHRLLSIKPLTKPPVMSIDDIRRALGWLISPSRKKLWLQTKEAGVYEISAAGISYAQYNLKPKNLSDKN